jgi:hypothetical protein
MSSEAVKAMDKHERTSVYIALLQDIHTQRSELNRLERIVQEMQEIEDAR